MAGEQFLLSGDQLATYTGHTTDYPPPNYDPHLTINGIVPLGSATDRFFLVRTQGTGDPIQSHDLFTIYPAVDDGAGGLEPDLSQPMHAGAAASPDAYAAGAPSGLGASDNYLALGIFYNAKVLVDLDGINGQTSLTVGIADDAIGGDGEMSLAEITAAAPAVACFVEGAPIATPNGDVPIETLNVGDMVLTYDNGYQPVKWIGSSSVALNKINEGLTPIRFEVNALGQGVPTQAFCVSPAHRIFWNGAAAELLFGENEVLIPAKLLTNGTTIRRDYGATDVTYWHILFEDHQIVFSAGLKTESFFPAALGVNSFAHETRRELFRLFPELDRDGHAGGAMISRRALRSFEYKALAEAIGDHVYLQ